jgi:hypothetical protein
MKILFVIFFGLFLVHSAFSQDEKIKMKARHYKDSVVLRWAPLNPLEWAQMNRYGYRIERYEINETTKGKINPKSTEFYHRFKEKDYLLNVKKKNGKTRTFTIYEFFVCDSLQY